MNVLPYITNQVTPYMGVLYYGRGEYRLAVVDFSRSIQEIINAYMPLEGNRVTINSYIWRKPKVVSTPKRKELIFLTSPIKGGMRQEITFKRTEYGHVTMYIGYPSPITGSFAGFPWDYFTDGIYRYAKSKNTRKLDRYQ